MTIIDIALASVHSMSPQKISENKKGFHPQKLRTNKKSVLILLHFWEYETGKVRQIYESIFQVNFILKIMKLYPFPECSLLRVTLYY